MLKIIRYPLGALSLVLAMGFTPLKLNSEPDGGMCHSPIPAKGLFTALSKSFDKTSKFSEWHLALKGISENAFNYAIKGFDYLSRNIKNKDIITIIDFSKPSSEKRLFVLDLKSGHVLFNTLVAHGKNSGKAYATAFSNQESSYESSLGFYITMETYNGNNGYSLRLKGCEKGFNDKATERAIVIHGADYVSDQFVSANGYLGRSHGCPALPNNCTKEIIDVIKNGTCLFIYHPTKNYIEKSSVING
jgi:L,D-transpeptidase catalytic domain